MKIAFPIAFLLFAFVSNAQSRFAPGLLVTKEGDTLRGLVSWQKNRQPERPVLFKTDQAAEEKPYSWPDLTYAQQEGDENIIGVYEVVRDLTYVDRIDFQIRLKDSLVTETLPLRRIFHGRKLSLYHFYENRDHFFLFDGITMTELIQKYKYPTDWDNLTTFRDAPKFTILQVFKDQIRPYYEFAGDRKMMNLLEATNLEEKDLIRLIRRLNEKMD